MVLLKTYETLKTIKTIPHYKRKYDEHITKLALRLYVNYLSIECYTMEWRFCLMCFDVEFGILECWHACMSKLDQVNRKQSHGWKTLVLWSIWAFFAELCVTWPINWSSKIDQDRKNKPNITEKIDCNLKLTFRYLFWLNRMENKAKIKAILIDLSGTIHIDDDPTPHAIEALQK